MFCFKKKKEPNQDELYVFNLLKSLNLLDIKEMVKRAKEISGKNDAIQLEFILNLIKPELQKCIELGKTEGYIKGLELDWNKYYIPRLYRDSLNKHGLRIQIVDDSIRDYKSYPSIVVTKEATELQIHFSIHEVENGR